MIYKCTKQIYMPCVFTYINEYECNSYIVYNMIASNT